MTIERATLSATALALVLAVSILFCACAPEDMSGVTQAPTPTPNITAEEQFTDNSTITSLLATTPAHISRELGSNVQVEADVTLPQVEEINLIHAGIAQFNEDYAVNVLFNNEKPNKEIIEDTTIYTQGTKGLNISSNSIGYIAGDDIYNLPLWTIGDKAPHTYGEIYQKSSIALLAREDAIAQARELLTGIGLTVGEPEVYALDCETMQAWQDQVLAEEDFTFELEHGKIKLKETLQPEDEAYLMFFPMMIRDVPVTRLDNDSNVYDVFLPGASIQIMVTPKGIFSCWILGIYQEESVEAQIPKLITVDEALTVAQQRWSSTLSTSHFEITRIALEYAPLPNPESRQHLTYTPAWVFTARESGPDARTGNTLSREVRFFVNAVNGEVIE